MDIHEIDGSSHYKKVFSPHVQYLNPNGEMDIKSHPIVRILSRAWHEFSMPYDLGPFSGSFSIFLWSNFKFQSIISDEKKLAPLAPSNATLFIFGEAEKLCLRRTYPVRFFLLTQAFFLLVYPSMEYTMIKMSWVIYNSIIFAVINEKIA